MSMITKNKRQARWSVLKKILVVSLSLGVLISGLSLAPTAVSVSAADDGGYVPTPGPDCTSLSCAGVTVVDHTGGTIVVGSPPVGGGTGIGGGPSGPAPTNIKTIFYKCTSVDKNTDNCNIDNHMKSDTEKWTGSCPKSWNLWKNGTRMAGAGQSAMTWIAGRWGNFAGDDIWQLRDMGQHLNGGIVLFFPNWDKWNGKNSAFSTDNYEYKYSCRGNITYTKTIDRTVNTNDDCAAVGKNPDYKASIGISVTYRNNDQSSTGGHTNFDWQTTSKRCVYVSVNTPVQPRLIGYQYCFSNVTYSLLTTTTRSQIKAGGTGATLLAPGYVKAAKPSAAYITGSGKTAKVTNCTTSFSNNYAAPVADYGYYRITGDYDRVRFDIYGYPSYTGNGNQAKIVKGATERRSLSNYYAYSCNSASGSAFESFGERFNSLPAQGARTFDESKCGQVTWVCNVTGTVDIAGSHAAAQVMRDGRNVTVRLPGVSVTGTGIRDSVTHGTVTDSSMAYRLTVDNGVSPVSTKSTDSNYVDQYYKLWKANGTTQEKFDTWFSKPNANRDKFLSFIWSSDTGKTWSMKWQARFTAEFLVPRVSTTNGGTTNQWSLDENVACQPNADRNSNKVTVVRSINN